MKSEIMCYTIVRHVLFCMRTQNTRKTHPVDGKEFFHQCSPQSELKARMGECIISL